MAAAAAGFPAWSATPAAERAAALDAPPIDSSRTRPLLALLQNEGGKTLDDALAELREAADYCRYYAAQGARRWRRRRYQPDRRKQLLRYRGRGVFVCISPWNFPLAIFLGQVTGALAAGNTVVAKPAEQTPLVAARAVALLHDAGVPATALHLVPGNGKVGAFLVADPRRRRRRLHRLDRGWPGDQPRAGAKERTDRTADRRNRRHERDDRRCHGAPRAGDRRCDRVRFPLRRPALLGAAAALPAGGGRRGSSPC